MDRFTWYHAGEAQTEDILIQAGAVCLYDGDQKSAFEVGTASLTPMRLVWVDSGDPHCRLSLHHSLVVDVERSHRGLMRSGKALVRLAPPVLSLRDQGPVPASVHNHVKLSFRQGGDDEFCKRYREVLERKQWQRPASTSVMHVARQPRAGIVGIERRMAEQHTKASQNISQAFEDLSKLMDMARDMVSLSKEISQKLRMKQGDISDDDTVKFKSYLLGLGVSDPVTKTTHGTGAAYYEQLANELATVLHEPLTECGGMMTLADVYCRINRARGFELISPEDLFNACSLLNAMDLAVRWHRFESGVAVLQLREGGVETTVDATAALVEQNGCLSETQLAALQGVAVVLAKERLLVAEDCGKLCRDESVEGLRFFPNRFLEPVALQNAA